MEFVKRHGLPVFQLQQLLDFGGSGGVDIPYIGYIKLTLNIPEIEGFRREILAFFQKDSKYLVEVPLIIGTLHINEILACATAEELGKAKKKEVEWSKECKQAFLKLKEIHSNMPILAYADYQRPFKVHTDASESGLGWCCIKVRRMVLPEWWHMPAEVYLNLKRDTIPPSLSS